MVKANFAVFKHFKIVKEKSWEELVGKFTIHEHFKNSKYLRQVVFGNLNPKRQNQVQEYFMCKLFNSLPEKLKKNVILNKDELIFELDNVTPELMSRVMATIHSFEKLENYNIRSETFNLRILQDKKNKFYFIKEGKEKIEFKGVPQLYFNQVYREYFKMETSPFDLDFYYEGMLASFKERLF